MTYSRGSSRRTYFFRGRKRVFFFFFGVLAGFSGRPGPKLATRSPRTYHQVFHLHGQVQHVFRARSVVFDGVLQTGFQSKRGGPVENDGHLVDEDRPILGAQPQSGLAQVALHRFDPLQPRRELGAHAVEHLAGDQAKFREFFFIVGIGTDAVRTSHAFSKTFGNFRAKCRASKAKTIRLAYRNTFQKRRPTQSCDFDHCV